MWMLVMFDLPVTSSNDKRHYRLFRELLLNEGFNMMQFSVYGRHCPSREKAESKERRILRSLPPSGQVRILSVTDAQYAKMRIFQETTRMQAESRGEQLEFW